MAEQTENLEPPICTGSGDDEAAAVRARDTLPLADTVLGLVREVLQQDDVGAGDDVLSRGGNSLTVARLLWSIQNTFGVEVSMQVFFDDPTAAALTGEVERLLKALDACAG